MGWTNVVLAVASVITALNGVSWVRHGRKDERRFSEHGRRISDLENGHRK